MTQPVVETDPPDEATSILKDEDGSDAIYEVSLDLLSEDAANLLDEPRDSGKYVDGLGSDES